MNMIEELYHGNIKPEVKIYIRTPQYLEAMQIISDNEELLEKLLPEREKEMLLALMDAQCEIANITAQENFIEGFRLGARMGIDVMDKQDSCIHVSEL